MVLLNFGSLWQGPVDSAYAQMIAQSSNPMEVLLLAESIKRPKRQAETEIAAEAVEEVEPKTGNNLINFTTTLRLWR